jgi:hypothetical protein
MGLAVRVFLLEDDGYLRRLPLARSERLLRGEAGGSRPSTLESVSGMRWSLLTSLIENRLKSDTSNTHGYRSTLKAGWTAPRKRGKHD